MKYSPFWKDERSIWWVGPSISKEGSPSCGVNQTWYNDTGHGDGQGVFICELKEKLKHNKLDIPMIGVADYKQEETIDWLAKKIN